MTANPPAESPYSVEYPVAISLLFPVVSTIHPWAFDSAMSSTPRMRLWRFSSVSPSGAPPTRGVSVSARARWAANLGIVLERAPIGAAHRALADTLTPLVGRLDRG